MFLHLGDSTVVNTKDIIGIFDMDTSTVNKATRDYLNQAQKNNQIVYVNYDLPKSFVVTKSKIYISPLNTSTLYKRTKQRYET